MASANWLQVSDTRIINLANVHYVSKDEGGLVMVMFSSDDWVTLRGEAAKKAWCYFRNRMAEQLPE